MKAKKVVCGNPVCQRIAKHYGDYRPNHNTSLRLHAFFCDVCASTSKLAMVLHNERGFYNLSRPGRPCYIYAQEIYNPHAKDVWQIIEEMEKHHATV